MILGVVSDWLRNDCHPDESRGPEVNAKCNANIAPYGVLGPDFRREDGQFFNLNESGADDFYFFEFPINLFLNAASARPR
jgi:hypothetical protein